MEVTPPRLPLARPWDPYCRGLLEPPERRGWCVTCRGCREWRLPNADVEEGPFRQPASPNLVEAERPAPVGSLKTATRPL